MIRQQKMDKLDLSKKKSFALLKTLNRMKSYRVGKISLNHVSDNYLGYVRTVKTEQNTSNLKTGER